MDKTTEQHIENTVSSSSGAGSQRWGKMKKAVSSTGIIALLAIAAAGTSAHWNDEERAGGQWATGYTSGLQISTDGGETWETDTDTGHPDRAEFAMSALTDAGVEFAPNQTIEETVHLRLDPDASDYDHILHEFPGFLVEVDGLWGNAMTPHYDGNPRMLDEITDYDTGETEQYLSPQQRANASIDTGSAYRDAAVNPSPSLNVLNVFNARVSASNIGSLNDAVVPAEPTLNDAHSAHWATVSVPDTEGVVYLVSDDIGVGRTPPFWRGQGYLVESTDREVVLTAVAAEGYELDENAQTEWVISWDWEEDVEYYPEPLGVDRVYSYGGAYLEQPESWAVDYYAYGLNSQGQMVQHGAFDGGGWSYINGDPALPSNFFVGHYPLALNELNNILDTNIEEVVVVAEAREGYVFPDDAETQWVVPITYEGHSNVVDAPEPFREGDTVYIPHDQMISGTYYNMIQPNGSSLSSLSGWSYMGGEYWSYELDEGETLRFYANIMNRDSVRLADDNRRYLTPYSFSNMGPTPIPEEDALVSFDITHRDSGWNSRTDVYVAGEDVEHPFVEQHETNGEFPDILIGADGEPEAFDVRVEISEYVPLGVGFDLEGYFVSTVAIPEYPVQ